MLSSECYQCKQVGAYSMKAKNPYTRVRITSPCKALHKVRFSIVLCSSCCVGWDVVMCHAVYVVLSQYNVCYLCRLACLQRCSNVLCSTMCLVSLDWRVYWDAVMCYVVHCMLCYLCRLVYRLRCSNVLCSTMCVISLDWRVDWDAVMCYAVQHVLSLKIGVSTEMQ